jgi:hypothetical protein
MSEYAINLVLIQKTIDLVSIHQQNVGKRSLHLMDTVNAKKRCKTFTGVSTIFEREPRSDKLC